jgi:long-chain acyl-CoA synthetase
VLSKYGKVGYNDKVAMIPNNCIEWASICYATMSLGAQLVPMYEAQLEKDWKFIVQDSEANIIVCANMRIYDIVKQYVGKVGKVQHVFVFDVPEGIPEMEKFSYQYLMKQVADRKC